MIEDWSFRLRPFPTLKNCTFDPKTPLFAIISKVEYEGLRNCGCDAAVNIVMSSHFCDAIASR